MWNSQAPEAEGRSSFPEAEAPEIRASLGVPTSAREAEAEIWKQLLNLIFEFTLVPLTSLTFIILETLLIELLWALQLQILEGDI